MRDYWGIWGAGEMVRVPGRLAKFSLRPSPQPCSGGRIARSLTRRETKRTA